MRDRSVGRGSLLVAGLALVLMLASGPNAWATGPQEPGHQTIPRPDRGGGTGAISPDRGGGAASQPGDISVTVPPGAVSADTTLYLVPRGLDVAPSATGRPLLGQAFTTEAWQGLQAKPGFTFGKAASICIRYTEADLEQVAGRDARRLVVQQYDEAAKKWMSLPTAVDFASRKACGSATQVGWFALSTQTPGQESSETAPPAVVSTAVSARIDPQTGGKLVVDSNTYVIVPPGGVAEPVDLVYLPQAPPQAVAAADFKFVKPAFTLDAYRDSRPLVNFALSSPAQLCMSYSTEDLAAAGGDPQRLAVKRFDLGAAGGKGSWVFVPRNVDNTNRRVCATVQYLSSFALTSSGPAGIFGDTFAEPRMILPIIVVALVLVGGGLYVLLKSKGASGEPPQEG